MSDYKITCCSTADMSYEFFKQNKEKLKLSKIKESTIFVDSFNMYE